MQSTAAEDYVKAIYHHTEWQPDPITPSQLAGRLGLANSTVTEMVKKLAAAGLVHHRPYSAIELTESGRALAVRQVRRHRVVETWLVERHGYDWDEVHDEAEVLEHTISDRLLEGIDARLGRPRFDPHGDAIPDAAGVVEREPFVLLADAPAGHVGRVLRVDDRDPELLRALEAAGVAVAANITTTPSGIELDGTETELPDGAAQVVWLSA